MKEKLRKVVNTKANENICTSAIIFRGNKILLGNRVYPEKNFSVWNFPGGRCNDGETIGDALIREVNEEIGINKQDFKILDFIGTIKGSWKDDVVYLFHCSIYGEPRLMEPEKFEEWKWADFNEELQTHSNNEAIKLIFNFLSKSNP